MNKNIECTLKNESCCLTDSKNVDCPMNKACTLKDESCCLSNSKNVDCPMNKACTLKDESCSLKDSRDLSYPFIHNKEIMTDYEMHTDGMTSEIGFARSFVKDEDTRKDLQIICEEVLHLNPMIRKPDSSIIEHSYSIFNNLYEKYNKPYKGFYLPLGDSGATAISRLRYTSKQIIRLLVWSDHEDKTLRNCFNILTNLFHLMWMQISDEKVEFTSKSYK